MASKRTILKEIDSMEELADRIKIIATGLRKKLGPFPAPAPTGGRRIPEAEIAHVLAKRKKFRYKKIA